MGESAAGVDWRSKADKELYLASERIAKYMKEQQVQVLESAANLNAAVMEMLESANKSSGKRTKYMEDTEEHLNRAWNRVDSANLQLDKALEELEDSTILAVTGLLVLSHGIASTAVKALRNEYEKQSTPDTPPRAAVREVRAAVMGLNYNQADLSDPAKSTELYLPVLGGSDIGVVPGKFRYMGRKSFQDLLTFITNAPPSQTAYYTGLPGSGKSYIFAAAAVELFRRSVSGSSAPHYVYLDGEHFARNPEQALRRALMLSLPTEEDVLCSVTDVTEWISVRRQALIFLVDEGQVFDNNRSKNVEGLSDKDRSYAHKILDSVQDAGHSIVKCCSINSKVYGRIAHRHKFATHLIAAPQFTKVELESYLRFFRQDLAMTDKNSELDEKKLEELMLYTGGVPRLVFQYKRSGFDAVNNGYIEDMQKFVRECMEDTEKMQIYSFMAVVAGRKTSSSLPREMLSKCFYFEGGRGTCITSLLLLKTRAYIALTLEVASTDELHSALVAYLGSFPTDVRKGRIGHNAEDAVILVAKAGFNLKLMLSTRFQLKIRPEVINIVLRDFSFDQTGRPTLYIPVDKNFQGLDLFYSDAHSVVCFQVTVFRKPVGSHPSTRTAFEKMTAGETKRHKYLVWVTSAATPSVKRHPSNFTEVFCCFGDVHGELKVIDTVASKLDQDAAAETASSAADQAADAQAANLATAAPQAAGPTAGLAPPAKVARRAADSTAPPAKVARRAVCKGTTQKKVPCHSTPANGEEYCYRHRDQVP